MSRRHVVWRGVAGGVLALATAALYIALIVSQRNDDAAEVVPWAATFVASGAVAIAASFLRPGRLKVVLLGVPAVVLGATGVLAVFSIGIPLLVAAVLLAAAATYSSG